MANEDFKPELLQLGGALSSDLVRRMKAQGQNKSGRTIRRIIYEATPSSLTMYGPSYLQTLETGRPPTRSKVSSSPSLYDRILEWLNYVNIVSKLSKRSLAFLIARKIHNEGTRLYRRKGDTRILKDTFRIERLDAFFGALGKQYLTRISSDTIKEIDKAADRLKN